MTIKSDTGQHLMSYSLSSGLSSLWSKPEFDVIITMGVVTAPNCLAVVERPEDNDSDQDLDDFVDNDNWWWAWAW